MYNLYLLSLSIYLNYDLFIGDRGCIKEGSSKYYVLPDGAS